MSFSISNYVRLGEVSNIIDSLHETPKYSEKGYPMVRVTDIKYGFLKLDNTLRVDESVYNKFTRKYKPKRGDIFISRVGSYNGVTTYIDTNKELCLGQNTALINPISIDSLFLYYAFQSREVKHQIESFSVGSAKKTLSLKNIKEIKIPYPDIGYQQQIGHILYDMDEKIETNNEINKKLEEMAQAIFKQWFVDFEFLNEEGKPYKSSGGEMIESEIGMIPKGWEVKTLDNILTTIEAGNRPKGGVGNLIKGIPSIGAENIIGLGKYSYNKEKFVSEDYFNKMKKGIVASSDVLLYKDGAQLGRKTMFMDEFPHKCCCVNSHVFILRSNDLISQSYLYFWLDQDYMTQNIVNLNANSAQPGINQTQVKSLKILIANKNIVNKFDNIIMPFLKKIFANCNQNRILENLRDTLLPKLMSGEARVPLDDN